MDSDRWLWPAAIAFMYAVTAVAIMVHVARSDDAEGRCIQWESVRVGKIEVPECVKREGAG